VPVLYLRHHVLSERRAHRAARAQPAEGSGPPMTPEQQAMQPTFAGLVAAGVHVERERWRSLSWSETAGRTEAAGTNPRYVLAKIQPGQASGSRWRPAIGRRELARPGLLPTDRRFPSSADVTPAAGRNASARPRATREGATSRAQQTVDSDTSARRQTK